MEPISAFSTIVGLLAAWKSSADAHDEKGVSEYLEWLRRHDHGQIVSLITENKELLQALNGIIAWRHEDLVNRLNNLNQTLSAVARHVADFKPLANALDAPSQLSEQAVSILRQINDASASKVIEIKCRDGTTYQTLDGQRKVITVTEERFIEDDLLFMCDLGLLRLSHGSAGSRIFSITRAGSYIGG